MALVSKTFSQIITFTRASTATYFDATGTLQSAAIDTPRFDYDPDTLAARGFLIEEARTNSLLQSEDFTTTWSTADTTVTADAVVAPDGTTTADKLVEDATTSSHSISQNVTVSASTTYSFSVFLKTAGRNAYIRYDRTGSSGDNIIVTLNLSTGTVVSAVASGIATLSGSSIVPVGNGWYRCTLSGSLGANTDGRVRVFLLDGTTVSYTGDGVSGVYIWGAQLEAGAFPTSYIPTTTTALTRSADVASVNTLSPWFNSVSGTLYAEVTSTGYVLNSNFPLVASIDDGTANNRLTLFQGASSVGLTFNVRSASVSTTIADSNVDLSATPAKIAGAYSGTSVTQSVNGNAAITGTSNGVPSGLTAIKLGNSAVGYLSILNGHLRRVTYYPRALSAAELQALTA